MTARFGRIVQVYVGPEGQQGRRFGNDDTGKPGHHIKFTTHSATKNKPPEMRLTLFNLSPESIALFNDPKAVVSLRVGYKTHGVRQWFIGNPVRDSQRMQKSGGDRALEVTVRDCGRKIDFGRLELSISGLATGRQVFDQILSQSGLGEGQVDLGDLKWTRRYAFSGTFTQAMDNLVQAAGGGREWFIRDGAVFVIKRGDVTQERGPIFSSEDATLVGIPEPLEQGGVRFKGLLDVSMRVGRVCKLESEHVTGWFKAVEVASSGSNFGGEFYVDVKGVRYAAAE